MDVKIGRFVIAPQRTVAGELRINGSQSSLILWDDEPLEFTGEQKVRVIGDLYDQTVVTLLDCVQMSSKTHTATASHRKSYSMTLFPHFVAVGKVHFAPREPIVREISFTFEDAPSLFHDFDAFGTLIDATPYIQVLTDNNAKRFGREIHTGPEPLIAYFAGQRQIAVATTTIGTIAAEHCPTWPVGGAQGVRIDSEIRVSVTPDVPITFDEAVDRVLVLLRFITVTVGRRQNIQEFSLRVDGAGIDDGLKVHWSNHPARSPSPRRGRDNPHPRDLPLDPVRRFDEFANVLKTWLASDSERLDSRVRADDSFSLQNYYSASRLVGVANAFDIMPQSAVPKRVQLTDELSAAKKKCREIFHALPESDERESLLRAVGRLGHATLKQKVRHRAGIITSAKGGQFFESLDYICNCAVECRNHYVHGSEVGFDFAPPTGNVSFLTDTLEFVFAASELIEGGWNIARFLEAGTMMTHPFGTYVATYYENLQKLRASVDAGRGKDVDE